MTAKKGMADHFGPRHGLAHTAQRVRNPRVVLRRLWGSLAEYRIPLLGVALLVALATGLGLWSPYLIRLAIDRHIATRDLRGFAHLAGLLIVASVAKSGSTWLQSVEMIRITQKTVRDIRRDLFGRLQNLPLRFFDQNSHGDLMSRITNDTDTISSTMGESITQLVGSVLSIAGAGVIMFAMDWRLALISLATLPMVVWTSREIAVRTRQGFRDRQKALGILNGIVEESIAGQRVIKVCCHENEAIEDFEAANIELKRTATRALIYVGLMGPSMNMFHNMGFAILAGLGGLMVTKGWTTIGVVTAFVIYADHFSRPLTRLANLYGTIQSALAGAERIFAVIDEEPEITHAPDAASLQNTRGEIEFQNVSFSYTGDAPVLSDVSFHVDAGQTFALIGPTGAGKTTIVNLLTRFYDIDSGSIRIDGRDIRDLDKNKLRRTLGIVLQDTFLFTDTVRENIRYGRPEATDAEVEAAAKLADADWFVNHLPQGYETVLSDAAGNISQGQRQLLAIARALLADPSILILDEATSSVDTRTEARVQQALRRLMKGRTSLVIAHRLNTIRRADRILVIENGTIAEQGTHAELLALQGVYHHLYANQPGVDAVVY